MKITPLLFFVSCFACLVACQKPIEELKKQPEPGTTLSSKDGQAVSAALKVWHSERLTGATPSPRGTVLQLSPSAPFTPAFAGRYAIIEPAVQKGDVLGYYLQVSGAKEHFRIDYSKPRGGRLQSGSRRSLSFLRDARQSRAQGNEDSAIVIALPASLKVPDTICVTYWAYDASGNVSNAVTTCIVVSAVGTDAANTWINGVWRHTASWINNRQDLDTILFNKWAKDQTSGGYVCHYDSATGTSQLWPSAFTGGTPIVTDSLMRLKYHYTFAANGGVKYDYQDKSKNVDQMQSTCTQYIFSAPTDFAESSTGAWNYNAATGKMILIEEFDNNGIPDLNAWEYRVLKQNTNSILLVDEQDPANVFYFRLEK